jgi:Stress responsive A/B Barrel Domain
MKFVTFIFCLIATVCYADTSKTEKPMPTQIAPLAHQVYFWLKNPDSKEDQAKLIEGIKTLAAIPQVKGLHIGVPASTEKRDVVDNSYSASELLFFDNAADEHAYQIHPIHQAFVDNYSHLWSKVVVYDSVSVK